MTRKRLRRDTSPRRLRSRRISVRLVRNAEFRASTDAMPRFKKLQTIILMRIVCLPDEYEQEALRLALQCHPDEQVADLQESAASPFRFVRRCAGSRENWSTNLVAMS